MSDTRQLLTHLHRGGAWAHLWTDNGNRSHWFQVDDTDGRRVPREWMHNNIYFTVNPLSDVPASNASGNTNRTFIGSRYEYVCALNTLYAEYDGKDYVQPDEYAPADNAKDAKEVAFYRNPEKYNTRALDVIHTLHYRPSVCVHSGGGYHCYWLLADTVPLEDESRDDAQATQYGWVQMAGADPGVSDLRRILRLPGTRNRKPGFGDNPPLVHFVWADFDCLYDYATLEAEVSDWLYANRPQREEPARRQDAPSDDVRARFNAAYTHDDLLSKHGYTLCYETSTFARYARPGKDKQEPSITVWPDDATTGAPALSVHFSSNDTLYSEEYTDSYTGRGKRRGHDAYALFAMLEHGSDWKAAYVAAKKLLGMWEERTFPAETNAALFIASALQEVG